MKKIGYTILLIIWMITVFMFSHQNGSQSNNSSGLVTNAIINIINLVTPLEQEKELEITEFITPIIRKMAHFSIYLLGGIIAYCTYNSYKKVEIKDIKYILLFCILYAISDEIHQYFIPRKKF